MKPLLQLYSDNTWGYDWWDQGRKAHKNIDVIEEQGAEESREDFLSVLVNDLE